LGPAPSRRAAPPGHGPAGGPGGRSPPFSPRSTPEEKRGGAAPDEPYRDVTVRTRHGTTTPEEVARRIKYTIHTDIDLTASVGVATSKLVAKIAGGSRKPDGLVLVQPGTEADFLAPLPIGVIPGLRPKTEQKLQLMGIRTVDDLANQETSKPIQAIATAG